MMYALVLLHSLLWACYCLCGLLWACPGDVLVISSLDLVGPCLLGYSVLVLIFFFFGCSLVRVDFVGLPGVVLPNLGNFPWGGLD